MLGSRFARTHALLRGDLTVINPRRQTRTQIVTQIQKGRLDSSDTVP